MMRRSLMATLDLTSRIETCIQARTHGQVRGLRVEIGESEVVLSGHARTYYAKQLAQHGAMDIVEDRTIVNQIEVC